MTPRYTYWASRIPEMAAMMERGARMADVAAYFGSTYHAARGAAVHWGIPTRPPQEAREAAKKRKLEARMQRYDLACEVRA